MRFLRLAFVICLFSATVALAAPKFPALTGRVVDNAHLLTPAGARSLDRILATHEAETSDQVVVVTLPSLGGETIENYGYQLGRRWGIGQKGKNNGVLLIVAVQERRTRIEVGYGLEAKLTDALCSQIINTIMTPLFRDGKMELGILAGAQGIVSVLGGHALPQPVQSASDAMDSFMMLAFLFIMFVLFVAHPFLAYLLYGASGYSRMGGYRSSGWSSSGSSWGGGGFSGGGGSFGGGGASGGW